MKYNRSKTLLAAIAAFTLLVGCTKELPNTDMDGEKPALGSLVSVAMPVSVAATQTESGSDLVSSSRAASASGFSVSFGGNAGERVSTKTVSRDLLNVWILQFDKTGKNIRTINTGTLAANSLFNPSLYSGEGYTIGIVADAPDLALTTSKPATLAEFETDLLYTTIPESAAAIPLADKLEGVTVLDLYDGKGTLKKADGTPASIILKRMMAEVTLVLDFQMTEYEHTSTYLYSVPQGAAYGWSHAATFPFPDKLAFTDFTSSGAAPLSTTTSGTKTTYNWLIGENRRGTATSINTSSQRSLPRAPAYSTFVRIMLTNKITESKKLYYDIFLGSGDVTDFNVTRNHTYTVTAVIKGSAGSHEALVGVDERVNDHVTSMVISLTDNPDDSPIVFSLKSDEASLNWANSTTLTNITDKFDGRGNTTKMLALGAADATTGSPAAHHCNNLVPAGEWYLPAQNQLMLGDVYGEVMPANDRLMPDAHFWSSTESGSSEAIIFNIAYSNVGNTQSKTNIFKVRCVRAGGDQTTWKYPSVDASDKHTIASRDAQGGLKEASLLTTTQQKWLMTTNTSTTYYDEKSEYNRVSPKLRVANDDCSATNPSGVINTNGEFTWVNAYLACEGYAEAGAAAGSWRLPTQRELLLMYVMRLKLETTAIEDDIYWSGTHTSVLGSLGIPTSWIVNFSNGYVNGSYWKTDFHFVRCVRDID